MEVQNIIVFVFCSVYQYMIETLEGWVYAMTRYSSATTTIKSIKMFMGRWAFHIEAVEFYHFISIYAWNMSGMSLHRDPLQQRHTTMKRINIFMHGSTRCT